MSRYLRLKFDQNYPEVNYSNFTCELDELIELKSKFEIGLMEINYDSRIKFKVGEVKIRYPVFMNLKSTNAYENFFYNERYWIDDDLSFKESSLIKFETLKKEFKEKSSKISKIEDINENFIQFLIKYSDFLNLLYREYIITKRQNDDFKDLINKVNIYYDWVQENVPGKGIYNSFIQWERDLGLIIKNFKSLSDRTIVEFKIPLYLTENEPVLNIAKKIFSECSNLYFIKDRFLKPRSINIQTQLTGKISDFIKVTDFTIRFSNKKFKSHEKLHVYLDILPAESSLLRKISIEPNEEDRVVKVFHNVYYYPVNKTYFREIRVQVKDSKDILINFEHPIELVCNLRPIK